MLKKIDLKMLVGAGTAFTAAFAVFTTATLAGRLFPNEPLNLLPLAVFLSPLPMV